jgi:hypothetical protein
MEFVSNEQEQQEQQEQQEINENNNEATFEIVSAVLSLAKSFKSTRIFG